MLGQKTSRGKLFYRFSLEGHVPADHLLRRIVAAVDCSCVRRRTARSSGHTGRPCVDPVVIFRMALLGHLYGITPERRLVQEIGLSLAYRRFIGYDLDEPVPDHSALSKARARFGPTVYTWASSPRLSASASAPAGRAATGSIWIAPRSRPMPASTRWARGRSSASCPTSPGTGSGSGATIRARPRPRARRPGPSFLPRRPPPPPPVPQDRPSSPIRRARPGQPW
jgi:hypothetical protein